MPLDAISATLLTTAALMFVALIRRLRRGLWPRARRELRRHWMSTGSIDSGGSHTLLPPLHRQAAGLVKRAAPEAKVFARISLGRMSARTGEVSASDHGASLRGLSADLVVTEVASKKQMVVLLEARHPSERRLHRLQQAREWLFTSGIPVSVWREDGLPTVASVREQLAAAGFRCVASEAPKARSRMTRRSFDVQTQPSTLL